MVRFRLPWHGGRHRKEVKIPLPDFLAITKAAETLEELRVLVLTHEDRQRQNEGLLAKAACQG